MACSKRRRKKVIDLKRHCKQNSKRQGTPGVMSLTIVAVMLGALALFIGSVAMAQDATTQAGTGVATPVLKIDTGDTAWVLTSTALVLAMTMPGLALFYGGLVRNKNVLG